MVSHGPAVGTTIASALVPAVTVAVRRPSRCEDEPQSATGLHPAQPALVLRWRSLADATTAGLFIATCDDAHLDRARRTACWWPSHSLGRYREARLTTLDACARGSRRD